MIVEGVPACSSRDEPHHAVDRRCVQVPAQIQLCVGGRWRSDRVVYSSVSGPIGIVCPTWDQFACRDDADDATLPGEDNVAP